MLQILYKYNYMSVSVVVGISMIAMVIATICLFVNGEQLISCTEYENGNCVETGYKVSKWTTIITGIIALIGFIVSLYLHFKNQ